MKLAIDPGHGDSNRTPGKYDPGAAAGGVAEADVALAWCLTLKQACVDAGIPVWLTRGDADDPAPVGTRDDRAEAKGCTHFLSVHLNAGGGTGVETFYRDAVDKKWAELVHGNTLVATGLRDRGIKSESESQHGRLAVFGFDGPCCLAEVGFIDSAKDRERLVSRQVRVRWAQLLAGDLLDLLRAEAGTV